MKGFESRQSLSFSHIDVGDAFQFINDHIAQRGDKKLQVGVL